jgi:hypothetical protein
MTLYSVLDMVKAKPGMFGVDSAESIAQMIGGYQMAVSEHQVVDEDLDHFNAGFADWVRQANPIVPSHADWVKMIQMYTVSRQDSMIQFFDLLDKYRLTAGKQLTDPEAKFIRLSSSDYP